MNRILYFFRQTLTSARNGRDANGAHSRSHGASRARERAHFRPRGDADEDDTESQRGREGEKRRGRGGGGAGERDVLGVLALVEAVGKCVSFSLTCSLGERERERDGPFQVNRDTADSLTLSEP